MAPFLAESDRGQTSTPTPEQQDIHVGQRGETLTRLSSRWVKCKLGEVTIEAKIRGRLTSTARHQAIEVIGTTIPPSS